MNNKEFKFCCEHPVYKTSNKVCSTWPLLSIYRTEDCFFWKISQGYCKSKLHCILFKSFLLSTDFWFCGDEINSGGKQLLFLIYSEKFRNVVQRNCCFLSLIMISSQQNKIPINKTNFFLQRSSLTAFCI